MLATAEAVIFSLVGATAVVGVAHTEPEMGRLRVVKRKTATTAALAGLRI